jgi:hypothetical protein
LNEPENHHFSLYQVGSKWEIDQRWRFSFPIFAENWQKSLRLCCQFCAEKRLNGDFHFPFSTSDQVAL